MLLIQEGIQLGLDKPQQLRVVGQGSQRFSGAMTPINGHFKWVTEVIINILPETNSEFTPEAMDGWNTIVCFLLKEALCFSKYVNFREGNPYFSRSYCISLHI